jgi:hypothetical protein
MFMVYETISRSAEVTPKSYRPPTFNEQANNHCKMPSSLRSYSVQYVINSRYELSAGSGGTTDDGLEWGENANEIQGKGLRVPKSC